MVRRSQLEDIRLPALVNHTDSLVRSLHISSGNVGRECVSGLWGEPLRGQPLRARP
jgi:hypothetical protein